MFLSQQLWLEVICAFAHPLYQRGERWGSGLLELAPKQTLSVLGEVAGDRGGRRALHLSLSH